MWSGGGLGDGREPLRVDAALLCVALLRTPPPTHRTEAEKSGSEEDE